MTTWLVEWLRNIIAVILLAVIVDMLLPNKTMQRYARLAIGLIILLTILSPLLSILKQDIGKKLEDSVQLWDQKLIEKNVQMPTLEDIQKKGEALNDKYQSDALMLTRQSIEEAMLKELEEQFDYDIESIAVELKVIDKPTVQAAINQVVVTVIGPKQVEEQESASDFNMEQIDAVEAIKPIDITINTEADLIDKQDEQQARHHDIIDKELERAMKKLISLRWEVNERQIMIQAMT